MAVVGEFESPRSPDALSWPLYFLIVFRSIPVIRWISRWETSFLTSVQIVLCLCGFKTFTSWVGPRPKIRERLLGHALKSAKDFAEPRAQAPFSPVIPPVGNAWG